MKTNITKTELHHQHPRPTLFRAIARRDSMKTESPARKNGFSSLNFVNGIRPIMLAMALAVLSFTGAMTGLAAPLIHNVTGGGQDLYPGSSIPDLSIQFWAQQDAAGNVVGEVTCSLPDGTLLFAGIVEDLYVIDNQAFLRYVVTAGDGIGNYGYMGFEDNGQGANAPNDRQTFIFGGPLAVSAQDFANNVFTYYSDDPFPVEWVNGNIQVR